MDKIFILCMCIVYTSYCGAEESCALSRACKCWLTPAFPSSPVDISLQRLNLGLQLDSKNKFRCISYKDSSCIRVRISKERLSALRLLSADSSSKVLHTMVLSSKLLHCVL